MNYEREISNLLRRLGVNNSYIGFRYTIYGVTRTANDPTLLAYISARNPNIRCFRNGGKFSF